MLQHMVLVHSKNVSNHICYDETRLAALHATVKLKSIYQLKKAIIPVMAKRNAGKHLPR